MEQERRGAHVLGRLHERKEGRREERRPDALLAEERVRDRRQQDEKDRGESAADEFEPEHLPEEAAQAPPVLVRHVAEAVLRERLLDGEVEEDLEEANRGEGGRVDTELG